MKKITIIFRRAPHGTAQGREALDLALLSASFEQEVSLIFMDEGVLNLLPKQKPEQAGAKDYIATFGALSLYDIDTVLVCSDSLAQFGLSEAELTIALTIADTQTISDHIQLADEVLVF
ncbi:sulfurtransferase complex subunit TusC [Shewanella eurypsychrophilus]|uniref:Sulfurtransferase complex subunit TusC n=1 Tax=Shewanella eurypsychrophilus TaxID=2593656 RepID=A0ABX6V5Z4_9GAMM|nr:MULTISPECIES: sulfurtransferase complex subunit TusC [Shewanella]QFU22766.1 sulfurtransferase complex subunit TusC [Shewanella sp. YLB-09]QPG58055.1 sulfurtransferase complex subunit TusC [Shewanella eurypsychrophilus]